MKKTQVVALLLILAMMFSLAACGQTGTPAAAKATETAASGVAKTAEAKATDTAASVAATPEKKAPVTLRVATMGDGANKEKTQKIFDLYTAKTGNPVELVFVPVGGSGWSDFFTKLQTMFAGGNGPDLAMVAIEGIQMFVDKELALPFNPYLENHPGIYEEAMKDIHPKLQAPFTVGDKVYAFVCEWNNVVQHFNTNLLKEAGLEVPTEDWTKDQFLDYCEKLTINDGTKKQYALTIPNYYFGAEAWLYNNDASILNADMTKCTLNEPNSVEVFQLWQDLIYKYKYAPAPEPGMDGIQMLIDGKAAMGSWGRWPTGNYVTNNFKDVAIQYLPKLKSKNTIFGSGGYVVLNGTKNFDAAVDLAIWTSEAEFVKNFYSSGSIPTRKSIANEVIPALGIPQNFEIYYKSADVAKAVQSPPQYADIANVFDRYLSAILANEISAQEGMDKATVEIDAILAK